MRSVLVNPRFLPAVLTVWGGLFFLPDAHASGFRGKNGSVV
jgi:hypothetical protein